MNRSKSAVVWGGLLILLGIAFLLESFGLVHFMGRFIWMLILLGIGLPFWLIYLADRSQWWALFPSCILTGIGVGVLVGGSLAGIVITAGISLPFWLIYLNDRRHWWALIPGWTMLSVSAIVLLDWIGLEWLIAPFVMFAIAAPFLVVYVLDRGQWWALIPGGIMATIGLMLLIGALVRGFFFWPVILIAFGIWLIYRALRPAESGSSVPAVGDASASRFEEPGPADSGAQPDEPR